jgi:hypothetical protein
MRQATETERFWQIVHYSSQVQHFIDMNTSPLVEYDRDGTPVHRIRYEGITGRPNRFRL